MTERQYNSKLLGDKLSQLPVSPNEALWSRIEAQLITVSPVGHLPPAKPLPLPKGGIAVSVKAIIAIVVTILSAVVILWLAHKKAPSQQQPIPTPHKTEQRAVADSVKATVPVVKPVQPAPEKESLVKPTSQSVPPDTEAVSTSPLPRRQTVDQPLRDSMPAVAPPASATFRADSVKLPTQKKDEGYYFEVKKKKG